MKYLLTFILAAIVGCTTPPTAPTLPEPIEPQPITLYVVCDTDSAFLAIERWIDGYYWRAEMMIYGDSSWTGELDTTVQRWEVGWSAYGDSLTWGRDTLTIPNDTLYIGG